MNDWETLTENWRKLEAQTACPRCNGEGIRLENPAYNGTSPFPGFNVGNRMVRVSCRRCDGTGVSDD